MRNSVGGKDTDATMRECEKFFRDEWYKQLTDTARRLDDIINCRLRELEYWRSLSRSVSGSDFEEQTVLRCRYLDNLTWKAIGVSVRTVHRIHGTMLQHFPIPE